MPKVKLFCFPYAGGSTQMYHAWTNHLHPKIELIPVELSGRGLRFNEPLYNNFEELIEDVFRQIQYDIQETPYAFFGHSLGALIAFELLYTIHANHLPYPRHVFYSGKSAPNITCKKTSFFHLLEPEQFKKKIMALGGTPPAIFENHELETLFMPILKNDFKMAETYTFKKGRKLYDGEITVLLGKDDDLTADQCHEWSNCTSGMCKIIYLNGGHFFINQQTEAVLHIVNNTIMS
jgi:medium-chain acyl-[acyl-carrier-protein] hydrolase